jgi:hypothetical protein
LLFSVLIDLKFFVLFKSVWLEFGEIKLSTRVVVGVLIFGTPDIWKPDEVLIEIAEFFFWCEIFSLFIPPKLAEDAEL